MNKIQIKPDLSCTGDHRRVLFWDVLRGFLRLRGSSLTPPNPTGSNKLTTSVMCSTPQEYTSFLVPKLCAGDGDLASVFGSSVDTEAVLSYYKTHSQVATESVSITTPDQRVPTVVLVVLGNTVSSTFSFTSSGHGGPKTVTGWSSSE